MSTYIDYYKTLGVSRTATAEEIQRAYRKLAREHHPDVNKEAAAEKRFKEIGEAYEVLKDPEKRKLYDELGSNWKAGQEFRPPPGWRPRGGGGGGTGGRVRYQTSSGGQGGGASFDFGGAGGFSDFFESIFGGGRGGGAFDPEEFMNQASRGRPGRGGNGGRARQRRPRAGSDQEARIAIPITDAFHGASRQLTLTTTDEGGEQKVRTYDVKIPAGVTEGSVIRLGGQGEAGEAGGPAGDLLLRISLQPDAVFRLDSDGDSGGRHDLITTVAIAPWHAALGAKVAVPTPSGEVLVTIPPGSQSGQKLRLRGRGLPRKQGDAGDLFAELKIVVPKMLTAEEREAYERLAEVSKPKAAETE